MNRTSRIGILFTALALTGAGCFGGQAPAQESPSLTPDSSDTTVMEEKTYTFPGVLSAEQISGKQIRLSTEKGDIIFELFDETAPNAVSNFVYLANEGYFDGLTFHRREEGFVIQGGDPNGDGRGGPGYTFADELSDEYTYERGIVAMANRGPNTNGSQFFIMLDDTNLPKLYTIFGRVTKGLEVVDEIQVGDKMGKVRVEEKE